ncbi:MAG: hypothetical protein NTZ13_01355 [Candidatus Parcubacteria bacterium]|nr:hypothetical protein [Candidatus Parcubacteria bacterium]
MNDITQKTFSVICQKWEESESGWGSRPDGYSLHLSFEDSKAFIDGYWKGMPDEVPDEYSRPCGTVYKCFVSEEVYLEVKASSNGLRFWNDDYPVGDTDGWMNVPNTPDLSSDEKETLVMVEAVKKLLSLPQKDLLELLKKYQ